MQEDVRVARWWAGRRCVKFWMIIFVGGHERMRSSTEFAGAKMWAETCLVLGLLRVIGACYVTVHGSGRACELITSQTAPRSQLESSLHLHLLQVPYTSGVLTCACRSCMDARSALRRLMLAGRPVSRRLLAARSAGARLPPCQQALACHPVETPLLTNELLTRARARLDERNPLTDMY